MASSPNKRKQRHQPPKPKPLGVLEFTSALNGDDPNEILKKLHHFVRVVGYERTLALSPPPPPSSCDGSNDIDGEAKDPGTLEENEDVSIVSFDDDDDDDQDNAQSITHHSKRQKPEWQSDKNNYLVPFVGTSVAKGATGSMVPHSQVWPTGFLQVYLKQSPMGVELVKNEFVGAVPPLGVHKMLVGSSSSAKEFEFGDEKKRKKKGFGSGGSGGIGGGQSRGQIISTALQTNYWMALAEWISGFIPKESLQREVFWDTIDLDIGKLEAHWNSSSNVKCAIPPQIMTILMKDRLPEWLNAIQNYSKMQQEYLFQQQRERQQQKQKQQKLQKQNNKKGGQQQQQNKELQKQINQQTQEEEAQKQRRKQIMYQKWQERQDKLLISALKNLMYLCHLSIGTAREVVRRLAIGAGGSSNNSTGVGGSGSGGGKFGNEKGGTGANINDGISWMVQVFQNSSCNNSNKKQQQKLKGVSLEINHYLQTECLRMACTLLETRDATILSRIAEIPVRLLKRGGGGKDGKGNNSANVSSVRGSFGIIYVTLLYGMQRLIEAGKNSIQEEDGNIENEGNEFEQEQSLKLYARYITRLLEGVRAVLLPSSDGGDDGTLEFVIGVPATADLLSGEVLANLTQLSQLAPAFDTSADTIDAIIHGKDTYNDLTSMEIAAVEARRLLFLLLADGDRSPFLHEFNLSQKGNYSTRYEEQSKVYMQQLAKALHELVIDQGYSLPTRTFLTLCLNKTPGLVPRFFKEMQLSDPRPNYRSLAGLSFIESVVREAPTLQSLLLSQLNPTELELGAISPANQAVASIIPSCVTKNILGKVVQNPSVLLISSGLRLISAILRRARAYTSSLAGLNGDGALIVEEVLRRLPEVSLLLSIPSRFHPFESNGGKTSSGANALVMLQLCETLQHYADLDASSVVNVKFDWSKLVPSDTKTSSPDEVMTTPDFHRAEPLLQHRILQTLLVISKLGNQSFSSKMLPSVLLIMTSTNIPEVYSVSSKLAVSLVEKELFKNSSLELSEISHEVRSCRDYEASLWVDGISADTINDFLSSLEESEQNRVQQKIMISQAWSKASVGLPVFGVSSLLSSTLCQIIRSDTSASLFQDEFTVLAIQISAKVLLFQTDPKPFAAIIAHLEHGNAPKNDAAAGLCEYAKAVLLGNSSSNTLFSSLSSEIFFSDCSLNRLLNGQSTIDADVISLRQCLSLIKYAGNRYRDLSEHVVLLCMHIERRR